MQTNVDPSLKFVMRSKPVHLTENSLSHVLSVVEVLHGKTKKWTKKERLACNVRAK